MEPDPVTAFHSRQDALQARVNESAKALFERGIRPTVTRVRAALGGGSPNDLAPALKHWRERVLPTLAATRARDLSSPSTLPIQLADLVHELWQRALAAAVVEIKGGPTAREVAMRTAEAQSARQQVTALREQLQRESLAFGELRAQAARHEAIAREALTRVHEADSRERDLLRQLGGLRQRVAELEAVAERRRKSVSRPAKVRTRKAIKSVRKSLTGRLAKGRKAARVAGRQSRPRRWP